MYQYENEGVELKKFHLPRSEWKLLIKLLLATILSFLFSWAIGEPYSATAAVTANLFLYVDRGYFGGIRYGTKRVLVQIIQGLLVLALIIPLHYWLDIPIPDIVFIIGISCIAMVVGFVLNYRYSYAPLVCTLVNATYIIVCSTVRDITSFPYRILECGAGFLIGYLINYLIMPQKDRYQDILENKKQCFDMVMSGQIDDDYQLRKKRLSTDISFLREDSQKGLKKHRRTEEELEIVNLFQLLLSDTEEYLCAYQSQHHLLDAIFKQQVDKLFQIGKKQHYYLLENMEGKKTDSIVAIVIPDLKPQSNSEIILAAGLLSYLQNLNLLIETFQLFLQKGKPLSS